MRKFTTRPEIVGNFGVVTSTHWIASAVGMSILEKNGSSLEKIFKCTCMLADIKDWPKISEEYRKFFNNDLPSRSAFAGSGLALNARVEIECWAIK